MADTERTRAALLALFPDNTAGDCSPQDQRDFIVTVLRTVYTVAAATHTLRSDEGVLSVSYTATGAVDITLATAEKLTGRFVTIKDAGGSAGTNNITIAPESGSDEIDGEKSLTINENYAAVTLYCDGTSWYVI